MVGYEGEELTEYRKFYGRVIVRYHKDTQQSIRYAEGLLDNHRRESPILCRIPIVMPS